MAVGCGGDAENPGNGGEGGSPGVGGAGGSPTTGGTGGGPLGCDEELAIAGETGGACRTENFICDGTGVCLGEQTFALGPVRNHPDGDETIIDIVDFPGDYCTEALLPPSFPAEVCSAQNAAACADVCSLCVPRYTDADICLRGCRAEADTNSTCREGYQCDILFEVCDTGCSSDDECRIFFNAEDEWEYDTESTLFCNPSTNRCENPGTVGVEAGPACTDDQSCEPRGFCLDEASTGWPGGTCSKARCDIDPCAGDGICADLGLGVPLCVEGCEVGSGATPGMPSTYLNNTQGCRADYTCFSLGIPNDTQGVCIPGEFNDVTENNIGVMCSDSSECYSPFGQGVCGDPDFTCSLVGGAPGECQTGFGCTVLDCGVEGMPDDVCGEDADCIIDTSSGLSFCAAKCAAAEDCAFGGACGDLDGDPLTLDDSVCLPFCLEDAECRAGEACSPTTGECTPA